MAYQWSVKPSIEMRDRDRELSHWLVRHSNSAFIHCLTSQEIKGKTLCVTLALRRAEGLASVTPAHWGLGGRGSWVCNRLEQHSKTLRKDREEGRVKGRERERKKRRERRKSFTFLLWLEGSIPGYKNICLTFWEKDVDFSLQWEPLYCYPAFLEHWKKAHLSPPLPISTPPHPGLWKLKFRQKLHRHLRSLSLCHHMGTIK